MLVSILTATKNRLDWLINAYVSLKEQTCQNWEWIVINNGSDDSTAGYLYELTKLDSRVKTKLFLPPGQPTCIKLALSLAEGDWVGFLDDDDWLDPFCLESCIDAVKEDPSIDFLYTNYYDVIDKKLYKGKRCQYPYSRKEILTQQMTFHFRFVKHQALIDIGGIDTTYPIAWDYDMCLKLSDRHIIKNLPEYLYYYRHHPNQIGETNRIEQIYWSYKAIEAAIERRGEKCKLELTPKFNLVPIEK